jgi:cytidylate kinase
MLEDIPPTPLLKLEPFLRALEYPGHYPAGHPDKISWPFVTISRQAGAGGHMLAHALIETMQPHVQDPLFRSWQIFDAQTCLRLLEKAHLAIPYKAILDEEYHSPVEDFVYQLLANRPPQDDILHRVGNGIRALARAGKVIIIGRAGACVTSAMPRGIHIRLVAELEDRIDRMAKALHVSEREARELIFIRDAQRARLVHKYFGRNSDDPLLYDTVWNTSRLSMNEMARQLLELIRTKIPQELPV